MPRSIYFTHTYAQRSGLQRFLSISCGSWNERVSPPPTEKGWDLSHPEWGSGHIGTSVCYNSTSTCVHQWVDPPLPQQSLAKIVSPCFFPFSASFILSFHIQNSAERWVRFSICRSWNAPVFLPYQDWWTIREDMAIVVRWPPTRAPTDSSTRRSSFEKAD